MLNRGEDTERVLMSRHVVPPRGHSAPGAVVENLEGLPAPFLLRRYLVPISNFGSSPLLSKSLGGVESGGVGRRRSSLARRAPWHATGLCTRERGMTGIGKPPILKIEADNVCSLNLVRQSWAGLRGLERGGDVVNDY